MSRFYQDIDKRCSEKFLSEIPHCILPDLNIDSDVDLECESYSPYNYTKPIPYLPPASVSVEVWAGGDPATHLLKKKLHWKAALDTQKQYYTKKKKKTMLLKSLKTVISSGKHVWDASPRDVHFVELATSDPDKEFDGTYNWYYTGGCLDTLQMNDKLVLLTTQGHKSNELCMIQLKKKKKRWKPLLSSASTQLCMPDQPIYQVRGSRDTGYFCVRQHKVCQLYLLTEELELQHVCDVECDSAFTSIDLSPHIAGRFVTVTSRRQVCEWDSSGRNEYKYKIHLDETLEDRWSSVSYNNVPHGLVLANRNYVYTLDKRVKKPVKKISPKTEKFLEVCEDICQIFHSCMNTDAVYVCTSHSVLLYDIRSDLKPLQRWKHFLCSPPLLSCTVSPQQNEEIICIANQVSNEVVTIVNKWTGEEVLNFLSIPQGLPNMRDSLLAAHMSGLWLDPAVQHRTKLSLTGIAWLPPIASKLVLLSQTSAGDVFIQREEADSDSKSTIGFTKKCELECLANWEEVLFKERTSAALSATNRRSMRNTYKYLKTSRSRLPPHEMLQKCKSQPWEMSKAQLESYDDLLAPRILEVWEIEDVPEWSKNRRRKLLRTQLLPKQTDKVQEWLSSMIDDKTSQGKSVDKDKGFSPVLVTTPYEHRNKQIEPILEMDVCYSQVHNEISEVDLSQSKKRKRPIKDEYILGF